MDATERRLLAMRLLLRHRWRDLAIRCPWCGIGEGLLCRSPNGDDRHAPHIGRARLADNLLGPKIHG